MLDVYSLNIEVEENAAIPFNNVNIAKGITATLTAPGTIQLNRKGVYMIECDASVEPTDAAGVISIQLTRQGTLQPQAQSSVTGAADTIQTLGFHALVQVNEDNTCCCYSGPVSLQVLNTGVPATFTNISLIVTKLC